MRLELSTSYAIHLPAEEAVLRCYKLGFLNIQLGTPHRKANLDRLLKVKESLGLEYSIHAPFPAPKTFMVNPAYPSETKRKRAEDWLLRTLENAAYLGVKNIIVHSCEPDYGASESSLIMTLKTLCRYAKKNKQTVCLENKMSDSAIGRTVDELVEILKKVGRKNLKLCFDTGHAIAVYGSERAVIDAFESVVEYIAAVHLVPGSDVEYWDIHRPPEENPHFYREILRMLLENGYKGTLTFESVPEIPEEDIIRGAEYIRGTLSVLLREQIF